MKVGPTTQKLDFITYSTVVNIETVHIALTIVVLHYLEVKAADVLNAHMMAPNIEKTGAIIGSEFSTIIVLALYGSKSAGVAFRAHLAQYTDALKYHPCKSVTDRWVKLKTGPDNGFEYYLLSLVTWIALYVSIMVQIIY